MLDLAQEVFRFVERLAIADQDGGLVVNSDLLRLGQMGLTDVVIRRGRDIPDVAVIRLDVLLIDPGRQSVFAAQFQDQGQGISGGLGPAEGVGHDHERPGVLGQEVRLDRLGREHDRGGPEILDPGRLG